MNKWPLGRVGIDMKNLYELPNEVLGRDADEFWEALICGEKGVMVERIVSQGQVTEAGRWLEENCDEWVAILKGVGRVLYQDGREVTVGEGEHLFIPAHVKHRVTYTSSPCIWLSITGTDLQLKCGVK